MAELVEQNDQEQGKILQHVPGDGGVSSAAALDYVYGQEKPGPMQENIDSREAKEANRPLTRTGHLRDL
jgi:hypothetical protein